VAVEYLVLKEKVTMAFIHTLVLLAASSQFSSVSAWSAGPITSTRRSFFVAAGASSAAAAVIQFPQIANADATSDIVAELKDCKLRLEPIERLLEDNEWEKVRTILKAPPVNKLWNLGDVSVVWLQDRGF
jgi:hypothetical protein